MEIQANNTNRLTPVATAAFILCTAICGAMSVLPLFPVVFIVGASALFAFTLIMSKKSAVAFIAPAVSFLLVLIFTKDAINSALTAIDYLAAGCAVSVCVKKNKGLYTAVVAGTSVLVIISLISMEYTIYATYGSFIEGTKTFFNEMYTTIFESFKNAYTVLELPITFTDEQIRNMLSSVSLIIPSVLIVLYEFIAGAVYFATALVAKGTATLKFLFPKGLQMSLSLSGAVFFMVSVVLSLIFSISESMSVFFYTALNLSIVLFVPCVTEGFIRVVTKFNKAKKTAWDDKPTLPPVFAIGSMVILLFINPLFSFIFAAFYGAVETVSEYVKPLIKKDN